MNLKNKARIAISVVAAFVIMGIALGFKLNRTSPYCILYVRGATGTLCTVELTDYTLTRLRPTQPLVGNTFITTVQGECPTKHSYYVCI